MNKKGFIATSLILTFFLLFCAILLGVITNYNFNTNLIDKVKDKFSNDVKGFEDEKENGINVEKIDTGVDVTIAAQIFKLEEGSYKLDENLKEFPTFENDDWPPNQYKASVSCTGLEGDADAVASLIWNWTTSRWELNLTRVSKGGIECTAKFEQFSYPSPIGWYDAKYQYVEADGTTKTTTLLGALRENNPIYPPYGNTTYEPPETLASQTRTQPGINPANNEALMSFTKDDYGWSYYFRGKYSGINNYVIFANYCWKIIRVLGNGAIKLVVNSVVNNAGSICSQIASSSSYLNNGVSFDYASDNTYLYNNSIAYTEAKDWYKANIIEKGYKSQIFDAIWCNDGSGEAYSRISDGKPTLICPSYSSENPNYYKFTATDMVNGNGLLKEQIGVTEGDGYYEYKIGLLTADEVAFAGYTFSDSCSDCFLKSISGANVFTITRYNSSRSYLSTYSNNVMGYATNDLDLLHRQSIVLNPDVLLSNTADQLNDSTNPIGSYKNPYIIANPS